MSEPASEPAFHELFAFGPEKTEYRLLTSDHVSTHNVCGRTILEIEPEGLSLLASTALRDTSHLLRPAHLNQLASILDDDEASANDRFVAMELLKNANISAGGVLPMCQDTGTAIIMGKKGENVWTGGRDEQALSEGVMKAYAENNLRYSQMAPLSMFKEVGTGTNLPAQIDIGAVPGDSYKFMFMAKGGGSANKTFLHQQTTALLNEKRLTEFAHEKIRTLGTAACPPYHLSIVIGGTSAELTLKTVKLGSCRYLDGLPTHGSENGHAYRDLELGRTHAQNNKSHGHRRPVRRQIFLPGCAGDSIAASRRILFHRCGGQLQCGSQYQGQDYLAGNLFRTAGDKTGPLFTTSRSLGQRGGAS